MHDAFFEWDDAKADENWRNHGVSFEEARLVFDDMHAIDLDDSEHSTAEEQRFVRIGLSGMKLLFVSYTMTAQKTRIIHARKASKHLERMYETERGQE